MGVMEFIRRLILFSLFSLFFLDAKGQNGPVYKSVLYDSNGIELIAKQVQTRLSINSTTGTTLFEQLNSLSTDSLGVLTLRLGDGTINIGSGATLKNLNYTSEDYFFKVEVDTTINSSSGYNVYSNTLIGSMFYSFSAFKADSAYSSIYADTAVTSIYADTAVTSIYADTSVISTYSDTATISLDNLFKLNGTESKMKENGGILISSVTSGQRDSIASPSAGLLLYVTDLNEFSYYNGTLWVDFGALGDMEAFKKEIRTRLALRIGQ